MCNAAGSGEKEFLDDLRSAGWNPIMITIMVQDMNREPATAADAEVWKQMYAIESDVLYDPDWKWADMSSWDRWANSPMFGEVGFPWVLYVHTRDMRVWDIDNWPDASYYPTWVANLIEMFDYCAEQSGVTPD